jgi:xanthine dehydrogenase accessory factor
MGTIGGGHLEFQAMAHARALLNQGEPQGVLQKVVLGPSLGQCCGGAVHLKFEPVSQADIALLRQRLQVELTPVALFGGGHVGRALVRVLGDLPFQVHWIDSRDEVFPADLPAHVHSEHSEPVHGAVKGVPPGSRVLIMSFSHAEDLDVLAACLQRVRVQADLPFIGLIGSATKWATFRHRLEARGFDEGELARVTSPIGLPGIHGKSPAEIAVAVAAQLLLLP